MLGLAATGALLTTSASAMEFYILSMRDGIRVVFATGDIVAGDNERLRVALQSADRDQFGLKRVVLKSGGGLVIEALAIVALMDKEKVSTIVPPSAVCASACAQILFLAGVQHVVMDGGALGIHSCSNGGNSPPERPLQRRNCKNSHRAWDRLWVCNGIYAVRGSIQHDLVFVEGRRLLRAYAVAAGS